MTINIPEGDKLLLLSHLKLYSSLNQKVSVGSVKVEDGFLRSYAIDGTLITETPLDVAKDIPMASETKDGKMSKEQFAKLKGISEGANKVTYEGKNGYLNFDGEETQVYKPDEFNRDPVDVFLEALG